MTRRLFALPLLLFLLPTTAHADRTPAGDPFPISDGPHSRIARDDVLRPARRTPAPSDEWIQNAVDRAVDKSDPTTGGPDVEFSPSAPYAATGTDVAIASDGEIFLGIQWTDFASIDSYFQIYRSTDGGESFSAIWSYGFGDGLRQSLFEIEIAEGDVNRLFMVFKETQDVRVARFDVAPISATITNSLVFSDPFNVATSDLDLATDAEAFGGYYLYMTWVGDDGNGDDIWFARSTDQGNTWDPPYKLAELTTSGNLAYRHPKVIYGFGGYVHVAWTYTEILQDTFDDAVRYARATSYANAGVAAWSAPIEINPLNDGRSQQMVDIAASLIDDDVVILHEFMVNDPDLIARHSTDAGATWPAAQEVDTGLELGGEVLYRASTDEFLYAGTSFSEFNPTAWHDRGFKTASGATPMDLGTLQILSDQSEQAFISFDVDLALDPSRGDRVALAWNHAGSPALRIGFDAEWRGDPGFPTLDWEIPMTIGNGSPPAVVNLDSDPELEIVFADDNGLVHVLSHLGVEQSGWPQSIGELPPNGAVAVGALDGSGEMSVVIGNRDGEVYAFAPDGSLRMGFPVNMGTGADTFCSIGAIGGPYPRSIVVVSGQYLRALNYRGVTTWSASGFFNDPVPAAAAIGDLDGDGLAEMVTAKGQFIHVHRTTSTGNVMFRRFAGKTLTNTPSLGDIDTDGDLEIVVGTEEGDVYAIDDDGTDHPGAWPYSNPDGGPVNDIALGHIWADSDPVEVAFTQELNVATLLQQDGTLVAGYPYFTNPGDVTLAGPVLELIDRESPNLTYPTLGSELISIHNYNGGAPAEFPARLDDASAVSAAVMDIDLDGHVEVVVLTDSSVLAIDVNQGPLLGNPKSKWPMRGFDPARSSCLDCSENLVTAVDPLRPKTLVSFSPPSPNPSSGSLTFRYVLPARASVQMEVFDVRGRRIRTVLRAEQSAGDHVLGFDGRDRNGRALANGQYFGRLTVRGPGLEEVRTRKFSLVK